MQPGRTTTAVVTAALSLALGIGAGALTSRAAEAGTYTGLAAATWCLPLLERS